MDEKPPEITMDLRFLAQDVRTEFIRLFQKCLTSRSYGLEHRMDHGRDLLTLRFFMKDRGKDLNKGRKQDEPELNFDAVCGWLEYTPEEARLRIARTQTWDIIREYLESNGSSVRMPATASHIDALFTLKNPEERGPGWLQFYEAAAGRIPITASNIRAWMKNYTALPIETQAIETADKGEEEPGEIGFGDIGDEEEPEISDEEVPRGTKPAVAADVTPESGPLTQTPGQGPLFEHPKEVKEAIETIVKACAGSNPEMRAKWLATLGDPVKIEFQDILVWADNSTEDIRRIAGLATGDLRKGLRAAMRIVKGVIDSRTTLNFLVNRCRAEGGRLEHAYGPYKIVVTYHKEQDYET